MWESSHFYKQSDAMRIWGIMKLRPRKGQCVTLESIVKMTSVTSSLASLASVAIILVWFISDLTWKNLIQSIRSWIVDQKWDPTVRSIFIHVWVAGVNFPVWLLYCSVHSLAEYNRQTNVMAGQELVRKMSVPAVATLCSIVVLSSDQSECGGAPGRDLQ